MPNPDALAAAGFRHESGVYIGHWTCPDHGQILTVAIDLAAGQMTVTRTQDYCPQCDTAMTAVMASLGLPRPDRASHKSGLGFSYITDLKDDMPAYSSALERAGYQLQDDGRWTRSTDDWSAAIDPENRVVHVTHANAANGLLAYSASFDPDRPELLPAHLATPADQYGQIPAVLESTPEGNTNV